MGKHWKFGQVPSGRRDLLVVLKQSLVCFEGVHKRGQAPVAIRNPASTHDLTRSQSPFVNSRMNNSG